MKNMQQNFTWHTPNWLRMFCLTLLVMATGMGVKAQVSYTQNFTGCNAATCSGWTISGGFSPNITGTAGTGYSSCSGASAKSNIYSFATSTTLAPNASLGTSNGGLVTVGFNYKVLNYSSGTATASGSVTFAVQYASAVGGPWTTAGTTFTNTSTSTCIAAPTRTFTPAAGSDVFVRFTATVVGTAPDCWPVFDDISVTQSASAPCAGVPAPGNTLANGTATALSVCSGTSVNFSLQTPTNGTGVTYQWYNGVGSITGATSNTYSQTITSGDAYYCNVTCAGSTTPSNVVTVSLNSFYNCYCPSIPGFAADEEIYNVTVNGSSTNPLYANANGCATVAPGPGSVLNQYSNFRTLGALASFQQGANVSFSVEENECDGPTYYPNGIAIWIDYNQNGSFADPGEQVYVQGGTVTSPQTVSGTFTVPMGALTGLTGMRVISAEGISGAGLIPCLSYNYGETEDYLVNIDVSTACVGTPNPGNTLANGTAGTVNICPGVVNFSLQNFTSGTGVSYQWNNLAGQIPGATNSTYSQLINSAEEIYCEVTCSGNPTVLSGTVYVNVNSYLTCYCSPIMFATNPCSYINSLTTTGSVADITTAVDAGFNGTGFTLFPSTGLTVATGQSFNLNVQSAGTCNITYYSVWIDYDHSGSFDVSELMVNNVSTGNTATTFAIAVPGSALLGATRMRVIDWANGAAPDPCGNLSGWYGETEDYLINIVTLPPTPATPIEVGVPNCASGGILTSGGTAPAGITWYWQTSATGTSTTQPVSSNLTILANGTYYVRAQDNTYLTWSVASSSITVTDFPIGPADPVTATPGGNPACGTVIILSNTASAGTTNYWQGTNSNGVSTSNIADNGSNNYPFSASANGIYYVRAQDNNSFCWSNPVATTVTITPLPTAPLLSATPGVICVGSSSSLAAIAPSAPAAGYSVAPISYAPAVPAGPTNPGPVGDDVVSGGIPLGFNFNFYGNTYSSLVISTNGFVSFDASPGSGCCSGQLIPDAFAANNLIAACWTDLYVGAPNSIDYFNLTSPNRLVVRWNDVAHCCGTTPAQYTGQIVIFESGIIEIHNTMAALNGTMTQGIEGPGGTAATAVSGRNATGWTATNDAYRFSPIQAMGFLWTPNGVGSGINAGDETLANISAAPGATTTYTMTLTDPINGCQNSASILVNVLAIPLAPSATGATTPCGSASVTLTATGTGGTLRWYDAATGGNLVNVGPSFTTPIINATTTYYVEEFNGSCSGPRTSVVATYTPSTVVTASSNVASVCAGDAAVLTASSANTNYSYTWQPGSLSGASVTVTPTANTTYTVTGVDGFCVNIATVTVLSNANPNIISVTATPGTVCAGQPSQLFAAVLGGAGSTPPTYCAVTNAGSACITSVIFNTLSSTPPACVFPYYHFNAPTGSNTTTIAPGSTYTFSLVTDPTSIASVWIDYNRDGVYDAAEWAQVWTAASSGSITITVPLGATPGATGMRVRSRLNGNPNGAGDGCLNMGSGSTEDYVINIAGGGGFNYSWTGAGLSNSAIYNPTATPAANTNYVVTVSDAVTGCSSTGSVVLNVTPVAPAPAAINGATACGVGTVNLGATGTGGTLNWYDAPVGGNLVNTGATFTTPAIVTTTTYYVDETNGVCTGPRGAVVATFTPSDAVTATSDVTFVCVGGPNNTAVLTASSVNTNYAYTWQPGGMTGPSVTVTPSATTVYTVTGVDGPCTNIATVVVNGGMAPVINSTTATPATLCGSGTSQLLVDAGQLSPSYCTPTVGFAGVTGDYIESFTFNTISNLFSGDNPSDYALYGQTTTVIPGSTYPLTATPGAAWGQGVGVWIDYNRNGSFADAGEFVFSSTSGTATVSGNITIPSGATPGQSRIRVCSHYAATPFSTEDCGHTGFGEYEDYIITIGGGSGSLTFSWTPATGLSNASVGNPVATLNSTSTYSVSVSDAYGCSASGSVTVTVNQPSSSTTSVTNCGSYVWNGNTYTATGTYTYTSINAAGCDSVQTLVLTIACNSILNLTCFIEGYWDGTSAMVPVLLNQGETSSATACDTIEVVLHDGTAPYAGVDSVRTVLNQDGTANCVFGPVSGSYYIVVKNRSMVAAWSAAPVAISGTPASYNFTTAEAQAYGAGGFPTAMKEVTPGVWAFYSGDIAVDENVDLLDLGLLETDISDFAFGYQYLPANINYPGVIATDINGDGNVDLLDSPIMEDNISNFIFSNHP